MCFGGGDKNAARWEANIAKVEQKNEEADRQARILSGQDRINQAFEQFNPAYYKNYQDSSVAANSPQIEDQHARARDKATALLAGRGVLKSNIASNAFGDVEKTRATTLGQIANDAVTQANQLRAAVEKQKTDLYALNTSAGDPTAMANRAIGEATALVAPAPTTPLGDIFGSTINSLGTAAKADAYSPYGGRVASWFTPPTGSRDRVYGTG
jgi:K+/H+ antiporter YhaU regulatory subunit KhtT